MASFTQALDESKIEAAVAAFPGLTKTSGPVKQAKFVSYEIEANGEQPAQLQVFKRADGLHTLHHKVGKNQPMSEKLAAHVAEACKVERLAQRPLSLRFLSEGDWQFLLESLAADGFVPTEEPLPHGARFKVAGPAKDVVYIHRYKTGAFLLQGRPLAAYSAVVNCLTYTGTAQKELIESQLATVPVTVTDSERLLAELEQRVPLAWDKLDDTLKTILAPALIVHKLSADLPDYSLMVFPALRGMEGCIKHLFGRRGYHIGSSLNLGEHFDSKTKKLTPAAEARVSCGATSSAIENIYGFFSIHRNGLLHVDAVVATTRIIDTQREAAEVVDSALHTINTAYENVPN